MINIDAFKRSFDDIANPAQTGDSFRPDQFNRELAVTLISVIRRHLGLPEDYKPGVPQPQIAYEQSQMISNELLDLRTPVVLTIDKDGIAKLPSDYFYISSLISEVPQYDTKKRISSFDACCNTEQGSKSESEQKTSLRHRPVTLLSDAEFNMALGSSLRKPTSLQPIARLYGKDSDNYLIQFAEAQFVKMIYVRKPKTPFWNYTQNQQTLTETYNPIGSQDIELPDSMFDTLRFAMLKRLGVPEREMELYKYGQDLQNKGM